MNCDVEDARSGERCVLPLSLDHSNHLSDGGGTWPNDQYAPAKVLQTISSREFRQATLAVLSSLNNP